MTISKNIVSDYGAVGNGIADDSTAFNNFQIDGIAAGTEPVILTIPAGTYLNPTADAFVQGIDDLTILATGATVKYLVIPGAFYQVANKTARLSQAQVGDDFVLLTTAGETSFFTVGEWICISALEMQGSSSYPPNFNWFEYRQIASIGTGRLNLDAPLGYTYDPTFPATSSGAYNTGGPASAFVLKPEWNQVVRITGGTWDGIGGNQCQITAREFYLTDCTLRGDFGTAPTIAKLIRFTNCTFTAGIELDKNVETVELINCTQASNNLTLQSSSISNLNITGGSFFNVVGTTPRNLRATGTQFDTLQIGSNGYGHNETLVLQSCNVDAYAVLRTTTYLDLASVNTTYVGSGIFRTPHAGGDFTNFAAYAVPGAHGYFQGSGGGSPANWGNRFRILDTWDDGSFLYISTSYGGGALPAYSGTGGLSLIQAEAQPAKAITVRSCTGAADFVDWNQAPAGKPIFTYSNRTYSGNILTQTAVPIQGALVSIKVNVTTPFTGTGALALLFAGSSGSVVFTNNVWQQWAPSIDLRTAGLRTITPGSVAGSVGADSISMLASGAWLSGSMTPTVVTDISGQSSSTYPTVTVEMQTDQSFDELVGAASRPMGVFISTY